MWGTVAGWVTAMLLGMWDLLSPVTASAQPWASTLMARVVLDVPIAVVRAASGRSFPTSPGGAGWLWLLVIVAVAALVAVTLRASSRRLRDDEEAARQAPALSAIRSTLKTGPLTASAAAIAFFLTFYLVSLSYFLEPWSLLSATCIVAVLALMWRAGRRWGVAAWLAVTLTVLVGVHAAVVTRHHASSFREQRFLGTETRLHPWPVYAVALGSTPDQLFITDRSSFRRLELDDRSNEWISQCLARGQMFEHLALAPGRKSAFIGDSAKGTVELPLVPVEPEVSPSGGSPKDGGPSVHDSRRRGAGEATLTDAAMRVSGGETSLEPHDAIPAAQANAGVNESFTPRADGATCPDAVPLSLSAGEGANWAASIAIDPDERVLAVAHEWDGRVSFFELESDSMLARTSVFAPPGSLPRLLWEPSSGRIFAATLAGKGEVVELDAETYEVRREVSGLRAHGLAFDADNNRLWAARAFFNQLIELDGDTLEPRRWVRVDAKSMIRSLVIDPHSGHLYFSTFPAGDVFRFQPEDEVVERIGNCGWMCRGVVFDSARRRLVAGSARGVFELDPAPSGNDA